MYAIHAGESQLSLCSTRYWRIDCEYDSSLWSVLQRTHISQRMLQAESYSMQRAYSRTISSRAHCCHFSVDLQGCLPQSWSSFWAHCTRFHHLHLSWLSHIDRVWRPAICLLVGRSVLCSNANIPDGGLACEIRQATRGAWASLHVLQQRSYIGVLGVNSSLAWMVPLSRWLWRSQTWEVNLHVQAALDGWQCRSLLSENHSMHACK